MSTISCIKLSLLWYSIYYAKMKYQITSHIIAFSTLAIRIGSNEGCSLWHELEAGWCCHNTVLQTTQWLSLSVKREEPFPLTACTVKNLLQETFYRPDWNGRLRRQHVTSVSDGSIDSEETRLCQSHMEGRTEVRPDHSLALECPSPSPEWLKRGVEVRIYATPKPWTTDMLLMILR